jgi:hypothetical protein
MTQIVASRHADEAAAKHPQAEGRKRDQPDDELHAAGKLRQQRRPDGGLERREEQEADRVHEFRV